MTTIRALAITAVAAAALSLLTAQAMAQPPGLRIRPRFGDTYRVTVENAMAQSIILKVSHPEHNVGNYRYDLRPGESVTQSFLGGDRVVMVWDRGGNLQFASPVVFDQSGLLVIAPPYGSPAPARADAAGAAQSRRAAPAGGLSIQPRGNDDGARGQDEPRRGGGLQIERPQQDDPR